MMDKYYQQTFSLPCYPLLTKKEQQYVIDVLLKVLLNG
jgi:dTDP-4-amino-4,6-dideoxygalactose transaminase